jgi:hypothetical protein
MTNKCTICGEAMPLGESMFMFHGYSGPCPKPPLLQPHQARVVAEKTELDKKATALSEFIGSNETFTTLNPAEQARLRKQNDLMWLYSEVLGARISAWSTGA